MSDIELNEDENWLISFTAHNSDGTVMTLLSGADVVFRLIDEDGSEIFEKSVGDGVTIEDANTGLAIIAVTKIEQAFNNLKAGGEYFYGVRVVTDTETSYQGEGQLLIRPTVFSAGFNPALIQFRARFSEFDMSNQKIQMALDDAALIIDADDSWRLEDIPTAKLYLAAHLLQMTKVAETQLTTAGGLQTTGAVQSIRIEDRTVMFARPLATTQSSFITKSGLSQTPYGQRYLSMLRRNVIFLKRA